MKTFASTTACTIDAFNTQLGWMAILAAGDRVLQLSFGHHTCDAALAALDRERAASARRGDSCAHLRENLIAYAEGTPVDFADVLIDVGYASPFARRVLSACRQIPLGKTRSYAALAAAAGSPGGARAVGNVMAANRHPLIVPCHRVVSSDGSIGHFSAPEGPKMKARLLQLEQGAVLAAV